MPSYEQVGAAVSGTLAFEAQLWDSEPGRDPFEVELLCDNHFVALIAAEAGGEQAGRRALERALQLTQERPDRRVHLADFFEPADAEQIANLRRELEKVAKGNAGESS